jgi:hypothetical protein
MTNNEAMVFSAKASSADSNAGTFNMSSAYYQQIRSDFLQQSARYLRESFARRRAVSTVVNKKLC